MNMPIYILAFVLALTATLVLVGIYDAAQARRKYKKDAETLQKLLEEDDKYWTKQ